MSSRAAALAGVAEVTSDFPPARARRRSDRAASADGRAARAWGRDGQTARGGGSGRAHSLRLIRPGEGTGRTSAPAPHPAALRAIVLPPEVSDIGPSAPIVDIKPDAASTRTADITRIIASLAREIGSARFERYFDGQASLKLVSPDESTSSEASGKVWTLAVRVPSASLAGVLSRRFAASLHAAACEHVAGEVVVDIQVDAAGTVGGAASLFPRIAPTDTHQQTQTHGSSVAVATSAPAPSKTNKPASHGERLSRIARHRLEDFIVGDANRLAYNAVSQLVEGVGADEAGVGGFSTLVLHGLCGVGKTHLLQGAALRFKERNPGATVRLTSGEQFMQDFVQAIRTQTVDRFRKTYRRVDLLCIDDIHFLADKKATQDEMLHTFDEIAGGGARVILACDEHPRDVKRMSDALTSRFVQGMVVRVDLPETAMRERMARTFAARRGLVLDEQAARAIAERTEHAASARDLEGLMLRVEATAKMLPGYISEDGRVGLLAVERTLADERPSIRGGGATMNGSHGAGFNGSANGAGTRLGAFGAGGAAGKVLKPVRIDAIIDYVCLLMRVERADLMGRGRHKRVVLSRALISHVARVLTTHSFPEIAKALGRPNHSTIITACQRLEQQIKADEIVCDQAAPPTMCGTLGGGSVSVRELVRRVTEELARRRS